MWYTLDLPKHWVYVTYEDGKTENVANTDTLTMDEAEGYRDTWEKARGKRVTEVSLETNSGDALRRFMF